MNLFKKALLPLALAAASNALAEDRVVDLFVEGEQIGPVFIYDTERGLLISEQDFPLTKIDENKQSTLTRIEGYPCEPCLRLDDLGDYNEDTGAGTASIAIRPSLLPVRNVRFFDVAQTPGSDLSRGFALMGNVQLGMRDADSLVEESYSGIGTLSMSLGPLGVIHGGVRVIEEAGETDSVSLPTYLERHFVDQELTLQIGDTEAYYDPNDPTVFIRGFRLFRNFATRPDKLNSPHLDFYTELVRPSVIDLYVNSQKVKTTEFDEPGPVQLSSYQPSGSGKVTLVVTDMLGSTTVVETDFFRHSETLAKGVSDFSISGGALSNRDGGTVDDLFAAAVNYRYGLTNYLTLGLSQGYLHDAREADDTADAFNTGLSVVAGTPVGEFDYSARYHSDRLINGSSNRISWKYKHAFENDLKISMGATYFDDREYSALLGTPLTRTGQRFYAGVSDHQVYLGGNYAEVADVVNQGVSFSYAVVPGFSWNASYQMTRDYTTGRKNNAFTLGFRLTFGRDSYVRSARYTVSDNKEYGLRQHRMDLDGGFFDNDITWSLRGSNADYRDVRNAPVLETYDAFVAGRTEVGTGSYSYRKFGRGRFDERASIGFGFAVGPKFRSALMRGLGSNEGLAVIDTERPDVTLTVGSYTTKSNWRGLALVPVQGFGRRYATVDFETLPEGVIPRQDVIDVSVVPGQSAYAKLELASPGVFVKIAGARSGDHVTINGAEHIYYPNGVFTENVNLGKNIVVHKGRRKTLVIDNVDTSFPTYEVN